MVGRERLLARPILQNKSFRIGLLVVAVILIFLGLRQVLPQKNSTPSSMPSIEISGAKKSITVGKEFTFLLSRDPAGKDIRQFKIFVDRAELRDEIVVKGQKATAVNGRDFLIVTLKITNEHNQAFKINTRDYFRLSINGNDKEWLAPDIHNDPVEVQAISTKITRIGFPVNESTDSFSLQVGEIGGSKEVVVLDLK